MTKAKTTKRALYSSLVALFLCFTMLLGTTYAWFTDSVTSADNKIVTGDLDVQLFQWTKDENGNVSSANISEASDPLFSEDILWEPNRTEVVYLSIKNAGSLDLKYKVAIVVKTDTKLIEVMEYAITPDANLVEDGKEVTAWAASEGKGVVFGNNVAAEDVALASGAEHFFAISVHMDKDAGNEYQGKNVEPIVFDIKVLAGQLNSEEDSFGPDYDKYASYPGSGFTPMPPVGVSASFEIRDEQETKVGSAEFPEGALDYSKPRVALHVLESDYEGNFTIAADMETIKYDVTAEGLKEGNTTPVKVSLRIPAGKDPAKVVLYHYDEVITSTYNPHTGYVSFETTGFSPFTIVYDAESEYVAPQTTYADGTPVATVAKQPAYVGTDLKWGSFGQWSPNANVDPNPQLEAAFLLTCAETVEQARENKYANWYCDFYVKLDRDLEENQIFLGGNYGSFGWVGFHNGNVTLSANTEIGLLESVTTNPWTYLEVASYVGTFICGVSDVNNALGDATFTVMLRLTNPENEKDIRNVATITYNFASGATTITPYEV